MKQLAYGDTANKGTAGSLLVSLAPDFAFHCCDTPPAWSYETEGQTLLRDALPRTMPPDQDYLGVQLAFHGLAQPDDVASLSTALTLSILVLLCTPRSSLPIKQTD